MENERTSESYNFFEGNDGLNRPIYVVSQEMRPEVEDTLGQIFYSTSMGLALLVGVGVGLCKAAFLTGREKVKNVDLEVTK